jgi:hypothetical protein
LYGEDGMAGEMIEDLRMDILKKGNKALEKEYSFLQKKLSTSD